MPFLDKIFPATDSDDDRTLKSGNIQIRKSNAPMRKLSIMIEDEGGAQTSEKAEKKVFKQEKNKKETVGREKSVAGSISKLKAFAEQIRHRVHYIDKNDFAKKSISIRDKVYDSDLRRDLAYFLANGEFPVAKKDGDFFKGFEMVVMDAIGNEKISYVVYGEKTYVVEHEVLNTEHKMRDIKQKEKKVKKQDVKKKVAGLSMEDVKVFEKSGIKFLENLRRESQADSVGLITDEERNTLLEIFTKRFLREIIFEKKNFLKAERSFEFKRSEELVEFICNSIF